MATTPNYGWVTPAPTDFVTDLPADFEVFADAVDADLAGLLGGTTGQVLVKNSGTDHDYDFATDPVSDIVTTAGDVLYGSAADTLARLGIGTAGQVLAVNTGATAPEWVTPAAPTPVPPDWTLLSTTTASGSTTTITGLSGYNQLYIRCTALKSSNNSAFTMRFNGVSTGNAYTATGIIWNGAAAFSTNFPANTDANGNELDLGNLRDSTNEFHCALFMQGCNGTDLKLGSFISGANEAAANSNLRWRNFIFDDANVISSVAITSPVFTGGTIRIYGSVV